MQFLLGAGVLLTGILIGAAIVSATYKNILNKDVSNGS